MSQRRISFQCSIHDIALFQELLRIRNVDQRTADAVGIVRARRIGLTGGRCSKTLCDVSPLCYRAGVWSDLHFLVYSGFPVTNYSPQRPSAAQPQPNRKTGTHHRERRVRRDFLFQSLFL
jgi:hypothetical protein